jgi:hypothetical protein
MPSQMLYVSSNRALKLKQPNMTDFSELVQNKSNSELLKMAYEFDGWSPGMLSAVENELLKRKILPGDIADRKKKMADGEDKELSRGQEASLVGQVVGWLTVFGIFGIAIGYTYAFSKVKGKYSDKSYFKYNEDSRKNGIYLFYTSIVLSIVAILYKLVTS